MGFFQSTQHHIFFSFLALFIITATSALGQGPPVPQLGVMQTAETLGKGGYMTSYGFLQPDDKIISPENPQNVIIGNFEELHKVEFELETVLMPVRLTYGIGDRLDLILGGTFSAGDVRKIIPDFYRLGDPTKDEPPLDSTKDRRVYDQSLFDGVIGLKYNIKPDVNDGLPSVSLGSNVQIGFTADNRLNSTGEFVDESPADSFPFFGVHPYLVGTQRLGPLVKVHAGLGIYISSKSVKTTDAFLLTWQLGSELAFSDNFWFVGDFTRELPISGVMLNDLLSVGVRYEISKTAALNVSFVINEPGLQFHFTIGGEKERVIAPEAPEGGDDLLF